MRAVGLFTHGGPEVLQLVELPEVHAGRGQVRIRNHAATVNPTDVGVAQLGGAITDSVGGAIDVFGSFPDVQHSSHAK
jgi:NADPH:quinone reductase-like Zn-dependent oxidoreductase